MMPMPVWVILVVAGILLFAAIVLIIAIHILDAHAEQQCAHLQDLTSRSVQQGRNQSQYQFACQELEHCCMCGSMRNRRSQGNDEKASGLHGKRKPRAVCSNGLLQPLMDAAYWKSSLGMGSMECLSGLASRRLGLASGLTGGWFNGQSFFRGAGGSGDRRGRVELESSQATDSAPATANVSGSPGMPNIVSASRTVGEPSSGSLTTITATITTTATAASNSSSVGCGLHTASASGRHEEDDSKPLSQRKLVLEILMSPSGSGDGQGGSLPRATGVRLKLETNASLESLATFAAAASGGVVTSQQKEVNELLSNVPTNTVSSIPCPEASLNISNAPGSSVATARGLCQVGRLGSNSSSGGTQKGDQPPQRFISTVPMSGSSVRNSALGIDNELETLHVGKSASGSAICLSPSEKKGQGLPTQMSAPTTLVSGSSSKGMQQRLNGHAAGAPKPKVKGANIVNVTMNTLSPLVSCHTNVVMHSPAPSKVAQTQVSLNPSLDGLGSLRIGILEAGAKGKSNRDCSKGVTAEIASALAALNVDSIGGKGVGMVSTLVSGGIPIDTAGKGAVAEPVNHKHVTDFVHEEEVHWEGSGSEQGVEEGDEHQPTAPSSKAGHDDDDAEGKKKEKRKKRNRGRRHKAKAVAASAEAQDRVKPERNSVESLNCSSVSGEIEVGCSCGTFKGGCHYNSCPYPFTSSGSMVQRKIKEQYDELVRSNVAKTLTLAQVGRFTTCLVEAKSLLQQKSDTIQRRFTIAKSLLSKADKSSFDRLCGQIYGLEIEQKKLEEDTVVYNRLQEQLKLSPAYQKMLEYGRAHFELQPNTGQLIEKLDSEDVEISFEELLAQEKKDSFWQKHGPSRSSVPVS